MDKRTKSEYEDESVNQSGSVPDRRRLFRRLLGLAAGLGIAEIVLEKTSLLPSAHATNALNIDVVNVGTGKTELDSSAADAPTFLGHNTSSVDGSVGLYGVADATVGRGVVGIANSTSGNNIGVLGQSYSTTGIGVFGRASATSGPTLGVAGQSDSTGGAGVQGYSSATAGAADGVYGQTDSPGGAGVEGYATATSGITAGMFGRSDSPSGSGISGLATATSGNALGVFGQSNSTGGIGVIGYATASGGRGVAGVAGNRGAIPIIAQGAVNQTADLQQWQDSSGSTLSLVDARGQLGVGTTSPSGEIHSVAISASTKAIIAQGAASQSANLQEWQSSSGSALSVVDAGGQFGVGTGVPVFKIHVVGTVDPTSLTFDSYGTVASNIIGRRAEGTVGSPSACLTDDALLVLNGRGYGATGFSSASRAAIRLLAAENWTDAKQGAYIQFETTPTGSTARAVRTLIDPSGNLLPAADNQYNCGDATHRWKLVRAETLTPGDLVFENGLRATEEGDGLAFLNRQGRKIAVLDSEGNFRIKGKFIEDS